MTTVNLDLDDNLKEELDEMCEEMGMSISTFFMIYAKRALRDRKIPFEITANPDPFFSETNLAQLRLANQQIKNGKTVVKSIEELEAMEIE